MYLKIHLSLFKCWEPITLLEASCVHWVSALLRGKIETNKSPNSSFSHNFCHWLSKKFWKGLIMLFYYLLSWITFKACNYPLRRHDISLNKQLDYLAKQCKIFIYHFFFRHNQIMSIRKKIAQCVSLYMRLLH